MAEATFEVSKQSVSPVTAGLQTRLLPLRPRRGGVGRPRLLLPASLLPPLRFPSGCEPPIPATNKPSNASSEQPSNGRPPPCPCPTSVPLPGAAADSSPARSREGTARQKVAGDLSGCWFAPGPSLCALSFQKCVLSGADQSAKHRRKKIVRSLPASSDAFFLVCSF